MPLEHASHTAGLTLYNTHTTHLQVTLLGEMQPALSQASLRHILVRQCNGNVQEAAAIVLQADIVAQEEKRMQDAVRLAEAAAERRKAQAVDEEALKRRIVDKCVVWVGGVAAASHQR